VAVRVGEWLMRGEVTERIVAAHEALANPAYDDLLNLGMR
jgi:hypothetical protein